MKITEEQELRRRTAQVMLDWANGREPPFTGDAADDFRDAIVAAHLIADESRLELQRWVDAARRTGMSWNDIGDTLGVSKQAAQQRFKPAEFHPECEGEPDDGHKVVRMGATAFNEMRILREEGEKGNELVDTGLLKLIFRETGHKWEYSRVIGGTAMRKAMRSNGWVYVSTWAPFHYFKRRTTTA